jgi:hypothetical protein
MIFCGLAGAVSWALVFSDPPSDQVGMQPVSWSCFSEQVSCEQAAGVANSAFQLDMSRHRAACEKQPPGKTR